MVFQQAVTVAKDGPDRYGRIVGTVFVAGVKLNAAMIDQGMAWAYRECITDHSLIHLEAQARAVRRGLWVDPAPDEPWLFSQNQIAMLAPAVPGTGFRASHRALFQVSAPSGFHPSRCAVPAPSPLTA